ncbi:hypothetical protein [Salinispora fenicalii]|uniref:hypothetical protein n=1 Tax=Salinispora fenicalii TaxID=1137263 RepID=UPI001CC82EB5|nr:hypothetical protein [Salinispora fenicalii]
MTAMPLVETPEALHLGPATRGDDRPMPNMVGPAHHRRAAVGACGRTGTRRTGMGASTHSHDGTRAAPTLRLAVLARPDPVPRPSTAPSTRTATGHPDRYSTPIGNRTPTVGPTPDAPGPHPSQA